MQKTPKNRNRRRKMVVDPRSQGAIAWHLTRFWLVGGLIVAILPLSAMVVYGGLIANRPAPLLWNQILDVFWFPVLMTLLIIPVGIWHSFRFSNRIAGPVVRIQREIQHLVCDEPGEDIALREADLFRELADSFNSLRRRFEQLQARNRYLESMLAARPRAQASRRTIPAGIVASTDTTWPGDKSLAEGTT